eukprot:jgi/Chrzof1/14057/Cz08g23020.t1
MSAVSSEPSLFLDSDTLQHAINMLVQQSGNDDFLEIRQTVEESDALLRNATSTALQAHPPANSRNVSTPGTAATDADRGAAIASNDNGADEAEHARLMARIDELKRLEALAESQASSQAGQQEASAAQSSKRVLTHADDLVAGPRDHNTSDSTVARGMVNKSASNTSSDSNGSNSNSNRRVSWGDMQQAAAQAPCNDGDSWQQCSMMREKASQHSQAQDESPSNLTSTAARSQWTTSDSNQQQQQRQQHASHPSVVSVVSKPNKPVRSALKRGFLLGNTKPATSKAAAAEQPGHDGVSAATVGQPARGVAGTGAVASQIKHPAAAAFSGLVVERAPADVAVAADSYGISGKVSEVEPAPGVVGSTTGTAQQCTRLPQQEQLERVGGAAVEVTSAAPPKRVSKFKLNRLGLDPEDVQEY